MRFTKWSAALIFSIFTTFAVAQYLVQQPNLTWILNNSPGISSTQFITNAVSGTTAALTSTMPGAAGKMNYLCGFDVSAAGGGSPVGPITITGIVSTFSYQFTSITSPTQILSRTFSPCIPATAVNTAIVIKTTGAASATEVDLQQWGFQQTP